MAASDSALLEPTWRERWCHVNGTDLHVIEAGRSGAPLLVLLHGFPEFWWAWRHQITPLAQADYHVVVPDLRGYNRSAAPRERSAYEIAVLVRDVVGLVDAMGEDRFYLVGHDWGAVIGWCVAAEHPQRVKRAVLISGPHPDAWAKQVLRDPAQMLRSLYVFFFQVPRLPEALLGAFGFARLKAALRRSARVGTFSDETLARYAAAWGQAGSLTGMLNYYRAVRRRRPSALAARLTVPALVIWGDRDKFLGRALMETSLARCDRGRFVIVKGGSHWLHLEHAERITAEIARFLDEP